MSDGLVCGALEFIFHLFNECKATKPWLMQYVHIRSKHVCEILPLGRCVWFGPVVNQKEKK